MMRINDTNYDEKPIDVPLRLLIYTIFDKFVVLLFPLCAPLFCFTPFFTGRRLIAKAC